jgi:hypothetical protein
MRRFFFLMLLSFNLMAAQNVQQDHPDEYYEVDRMIVTEITDEVDEEVYESFLVDCPTCNDNGVPMPRPNEDDNSFPFPDDPKPDYPWPYPDPGNGGGKVGQVIKIGRALIALGRELYDLIKLGEPVVNTNFAPISVLPKVSLNNPDSIMGETEGWSIPKMKKYRVEYENKFGSTVILFEYKLLFSYGGRYQGKGKYIMGAQIVPTRLEVSYGFSLDSSFKLQSIQNHGSVNQPLAGALLNLQYKGGSMIKKFEENIMMHITGDGRVQMY